MKLAYVISESAALATHSVSVCVDAREAVRGASVSHASPYSPQPGHPWCAVTKIGRRTAACGFDAGQEKASDVLPAWSQFPAFPTDWPRRRELLSNIVWSPMTCWAELGPAAPQVMPTFESTSMRLSNSKTLQELVVCPHNAKSQARYTCAARAERHVS